MVQQKHGLCVGGNLQRGGLLQEIASLLYAFNLAHGFQSLGSHFQGRQRTRNEQSLRVVHGALCRGSSVFCRLFPMAVVKVGLCPSVGVLFSLYQFSGASSIIAPHTATGAFAIGCVADAFPRLVRVDDGFGLRVSLHQESGLAEGNLCHRRVFGFQVPDNGCQCVLPFLEEGRKVNGLVVPVAYIASAGSQRHQRVVDKQLVAVVCGNVDDKFCGNLLQIDGLAEMIHSEIAQITFRHTNPLCLPLAF